MKTPTKRAGCKSSYKFTSPAKKKDCDCWKGYKRVPGTKPCAPGSCKKEGSPNKQTETLEQEIARLNKTAEVKKSGGRYVIVKGKKMFKAKDGKLHTGQVSDLDTTKDPYAKASKQDDKELDKKEDAKGKGTGNNKKVMKDGAKTKTHIDPKTKKKIKGGVGNWTAHQFRK